MRKIIVILLTLALILVSCSKKISDSIKNTTNTSIDSTSKVTQKETTKDSIIYLPGEEIPVYIPCEVDTQYIIHTALSDIMVQVNKGKINLNSIIKEKNIKISQLEKSLEIERTSHKDSVIVKEHEKIVTKETIGKYVLLQLVLFWALVAYNIYFLAVKIKNKFFL